MPGDKYSEFNVHVEDYTSEDPSHEDVRFFLSGLPVEGTDWVPIKASDTEVWTAHLSNISRIVEREHPQYRSVVQSMEIPGVKFGVITPDQDTIEQRAELVHVVRGMTLEEELNLAQGINTVLYITSP